MWDIRFIGFPVRVILIRTLNRFSYGISSIRRWRIWTLIVILHVYKHMYVCWWRFVIKLFHKLNLEIERNFKGRGNPNVGWIIDNCIFALFIFSQIFFSLYKYLASVFLIPFYHYIHITYIIFYFYNATEKFENVFFCNVMLIILF